MAVIYLRSTDGNDSDDGSTWALAKATLAAALTAAGAGGTVYVSQAHAETQASAMTLTSPGTAAAPVTVLCVNDSAEPPTTLATTATVSTTGTSGLAFGVGYGYCYGITFTGTSTAAATGITFIGTSAAWGWIFERCKLVVGNNAATARINVGITGSVVRDQYLNLIDSQVQFAHASQSILLTVARVFWSSTANPILGTIPTNLFTPNATQPGSHVVCSGVDFSALGSGKNLVLASNNNGSRFFFQNCKLGAGVSVISGAIVGQGATEAYLDNCDSADTNYRMEHYKYQGSIRQETTIVRSSGASDGTTPISWKVTSLSGASFVSPLESPPIVGWFDSTAAKTLTCEIVNDGSTLTDAEIWLEVEYLGTSGFPLSVFTSDRKSDILATAANQTTSSVTWTTTGLSSPVKQKLSVTFTPQEKGPWRAKVMLAKPSATVYVCPKIEVT